MARIRTIKPDFYKHEGLFDLEQETGLPIRVAFSGLWTQCDREGRFAWRPRQLKTDILPYDGVDFSRVLDALATRGFVVKYTVDGEDFGYVPSWHRHQVINNRETASEIPQPSVATKEIDASATRPPRDSEMHVHAQAERKGREGKGIEEEPPSEGASAGRVVSLPASVAAFPTDKQVYDLGRQVLGASAGGIVTNLRKR